MAKKSDVRKAQAEARAAEAKAKAAAADREARTAEAKAAAEKAEAEAKAAEAKARVDEINAKAAAAEKERADTAASLKAQQERDADPLRQGWKVGASIAGPAAGIYLGHKIAKGIDARNVAALKAGNKQINKLGEAAGEILDRIGNKKPSANQARKLEAIASAAPTVRHGASRGAFGLRALRGPLGIATAAALLVEAGIGRYYLAPNTPNEYAKDAINAVASGSLFVATSLIGERVVQNVTQKALPSATALANIEAASSIGAAGLSRPAVATVSRGARFLSKALPGIGLALAIGGAIYAGVKAAHAGETPLGIAREAALGAVGLDGLVPPRKPTTAYLNDGAGRRAEILTPALSRTPTPVSSPKSDGTTAAYTRRGRNGGVVTVNAYSTPKRR